MFNSLQLIQSYWLIWLGLTFVVSAVLGGVIFRNYESIPLGK